MIPDYYAILDIPSSANENDIRQAYKKQSLLTHPDRIKNATDTQKAEATKKFQTVADAYYVLSDKGRRRAYDAQRPSSTSSSYGDYASGGPSGAGGPSGSFPGSFFDNSDSSSANFFQSFFGKGGAGFDYSDEDLRSEASDETSSARPNADHVFGDVFEELLTPEVERVAPLWKWAGAGAGIILGFIVGNLPGAAIGAYGGGKLGAIRDAKGKAVASVFKDLGGDQKAAILSALLKKVVGSVTSM